MLWNILRGYVRRPPSCLRFILRPCLLWATGRLLRREGIKRLVCYDIGARWGVWKRFLLLPLPIYKVGVEADPVEASRLLKTGAFDALIPQGLASRSEKRILYLARAPGSSSILGPDLEIISRHCAHEECEVVREIPIDTVTLDQAIEVNQLPPPDFIKLDVEGGELEIMMGGEKTLQNCSAIFFEARLAQFYRGEGLLGDICAHLIERGFSITTLEPVGSFEGAIMLLDGSACRNLRLEKRRQNLLKAAAFALVVDNFEYAIACLRKVATKKEIIFGRG